MAYAVTVAWTKTLTWMRTDMDHFGKPDGLAALIARPDVVQRVQARADQLKTLSGGKVTSLTAYRLQRERDKTK